MLRIRLLRIGKKNDPQFRVAVMPQRSSTKTGRFLEILGFYNPVKHIKNLKEERIKYWLSVGAKPTDTVRNMLISAGILKGKKVAVHKKAKKKDEKAQVPEAAAAEQAKTETTIDTK